MPDLALALVAGLILLYALTAQRSLNWNITAPMIALVIGAVVFRLSGLASIDLSWVHLMAEVTLVMVLFHDAATVQLSGLVRDYGLPLRLLAIGFPLALVATLGTALWLLPAVGVAGALLLAAAATPTDAGLGAPTVLNPSVPVRVRRALNVESGLNDGLATPLVLLALAAIAAEPSEDPSLFGIGVIPVAVGLGLAVVVGLAGGWLTDRSREFQWSSVDSREIAVFALPLLLLGLATMTGGNVFIAAFVGGLIFGGASSTLRAEPESSQLLQLITDLFSLAVWFMGGGLVLLVVEFGIRWQWVVMALLILTVLRMVPVWISLWGTGFRWQTVAFFGWFGPRGLATVIFAILAIEDLGDSAPLITDVIGTLAVTVLISVFAHGISAGPLAGRYAAWVARTHPPIEHETAPEPAPTRGGIAGRPG